MRAGTGPSAVSGEGVALRGALSSAQNKRADMAEHGHALGCYDAEAPLEELCGECRGMIDAMRRGAVSTAVTTGHT